MHMARRTGPSRIWFGHEASGHTVSGGQFLNRIFGKQRTIRRGKCVVVLKVELELARPVFANRCLDGEAGLLDVAPQLSEKIV